MEVNVIGVLQRLAAALALFVAGNFSMAYINPSAGGSGGSLIFPYATDAPTHWVFGSLDGLLGLLAPIMIGLAGISVLAFVLAFLATFGLWVPASRWRLLVMIGTACSAILLVLHPTVWAGGCRPRRPPASTRRRAVAASASRCTAT